MKIILCGPTALAVHLGWRIARAFNPSLRHFEAVHNLELSELVSGARQLKIIDFSVLDQFLVPLEGFRSDEVVVHHLVGTPSHRLKSKGFYAHLWSGALDRRDILRVSDDIAVCSLALTAIQMMPSLTHDDRIKLVSMLCGTYSPPPTDPLGADAVYRLPAFTTLSTLSHHAQRLKPIRGTKQLLATLPYSIDQSASSMETVLSMMLASKPDELGYGFGAPFSNYQIKARPGVPLLLNQKTYKGDLVYPDAHLDIEYMGNTHYTPEQARYDMRRMNDIQALGYRVIQVTADTVLSARRLDTLAAQVAQHLGVDISATLADRALQLGRKARVAKLLAPISDTRVHE